MWILFEGLDKTGKTTLEWELLKASNFKHIVIDRGPAGYLAFDEILGRATHARNDEFLVQAKQIANAKNVLVVYCYARESIVAKRLTEHGETQLKSDCDYKTMQSLYETNVRKLYNKKRTLLLDTSDKTINGCIELILGKLKEVIPHDELH